MDRERLTQLLEAPGKVAREDLHGLRELAGRHAWFSGAHLLLAAGEHAAGEVHCDDTLFTAAAHLPSRAVLFDLTQVPPRPKHAPPPQEVVPEERGDGPRLSEVPTTAPEKESREAAPAAGPMEDHLDAEMRRAALAASYELLLEHTPGRTEEADMTAAPLPAPPTRTEPSAEPAARVTASSEGALAGSAPRPIRGRMRFTDWLDTGTAMPPPPVPHEAGPTDADILSTPSGPVPEVVSAAEPLDSGALIERFIRQATPEPRPKAAFFTPQQAAKRSLDDTAGIVTETLARIYAKQGNVAKAVEAYRKLALKYPAKSAYFAALAKELEEQ